MQKLVKKLLNQPSLSSDIIAGWKRRWAKKHGFMPRNSQIIKAYKDLVQKGKIKPKKNFEKALRLKKIRSLSGIVPVAVMTKPQPCPGRCVYCPTQAGIPKSYLDDEPAVMRAQRANWNPYLQVQRRLKQLQATGHSTEKIELIVMGGTFSSLPHDYQVDFISKCFLAANKNKKLNIKNKKHLSTLSSRSKGISKIKILEKEQKLNETAKNRIIGLTLETRPDQINIKEIKWMRQLGATRVEIGVQSIYDSILKKVKRGHGVKETIKATQLLKNAGFKICYHLMPNLPGSNPKKDLQMFKTIFTDERFMPDMIKIYPCVVTYQAELHQWFKKGKYQPYTDKELIDLLIKIKKIVPPWVRINRLGRDIPVANISAGNKLSNIRQVLRVELEKRKIKCQCIRCREVRNKKIKNLKLKIKNYSAFGGQEYFLQFVDSKKQLYALLRLRIPSQFYRGVLRKTPLRCPTLDTLEELKNCALIRELHTYGESLPIEKSNFKAVQHEGLGKKLIQKAEEITKNQEIKKIAVISGVGVRGYYRKLGYQLKNNYMVKCL